MIQLLLTRILLVSGNQKLRKLTEDMTLFFKTAIHESILLILIIAISSGCGDDQKKAFRILRLADATLIKSVESKHMDILEGHSCYLEQGEEVAKLNAGSKWHPFYVPIELEGLSISGHIPALKTTPAMDGRGIRIQPRTGIACIFPVRPGTELYAECKGSFSAASNCLVYMLQLSSIPALLKTSKPGFLKNIIEHSVSEPRRMLRLNPTDDGQGASGIFKLNANARGILFMVFSKGKEEGFFESADIFTLTPSRTFLYDRKRRSIPHPALAPVPFIEGTVRPSFLLPPGTTIKLKAYDIPDASELHCALGLVEPPSASIEFSMTGYNEKGQGQEILHAVIGPGSKGWQWFKRRLDTLAGSSIRFTLHCEWADQQATPPSGVPPLLCCGSPAIHRKKPTPSDPPFNLILVSLDTLRADHLGCYGYARPVSPNIDRFAERGIQFMNFYAQAPWTLPFHVSLFTSLYPPAHGVNTPLDQIPGRLILLAQMLSRSDMATASYNNGGFLSHEYGFHKGFDQYCEVEPLGDRFYSGKSFSNTNHLADGSTGSLKNAFSWLQEMKDYPFFLFLHTFMIHEYQPPKKLAEIFNANCPSKLRPGRESRKWIDAVHVRDHGISQDDLMFFVNMYDASIRAADEMIGELLDHLDALGLLDQTIVAITSDHGEEFLDHGSVGHTDTVYEELIRVPLILYVPGFPTGIQVKSRVNQVDLLPTFLELLYIEGSEVCQGRSLTPLMQDRDAQDRIIYSDTRGRSSRSCLIKNGWKYIEGSMDKHLQFPAPAPVELFRLEKDVSETNNLINDNGTLGNRFDIMMKSLDLEMKRIRDALMLVKEQSGVISDELKEALRQQGYM